MRFNSMVSALAVLGLAACGGGSTGGGPEEVEVTLADRANAFDALEAGLPVAGTIWSQIPTTGRAHFRGAAEVAIGAGPGVGPDEATLLGDADITVRFANANPVQGRISNFEGVSGEDLRSGREIDVAGTLTIGEVASQIGDDRAEPGIDVNPNGFLTTVSGELDLLDDTFEMFGVVEGVFLGTRVDNPNTDIPMRALSATGDLFVVNAQSNDLGAAITIVADNTDG